MSRAYSQSRDEGVFRYRRVTLVGWFGIVVVGAAAIMLGGPMFVRGLVTLIRQPIPLSVPGPIAVLMHVLLWLVIAVMTIAPLLGTLFFGALAYLHFRYGRDIIVVDAASGICRERERERVCIPWQDVTAVRRGFLRYKVIGRKDSIFIGIDIERPDELFGIMRQRLPDTIEVPRPQRI
jgi:hypothetical protein